MVDEIDIKIIKNLSQNARMNASEIGDRISMSVSAVIERIRKLEAAGVIRQYSLVLDPQKIGKGVCAFVSISLEHPKYNQGFIEAVNQNPDIVECNYVTGDFDFLVKVMTASTESLSGLLNEIKCIRGVSLTRTLVVLSTTKNTYGPLL